MRAAQGDVAGAHEDGRGDDEVAAGQSGTLGGLGHFAITLRATGLRGELPDVGGGQYPSPPSSRQADMSPRIILLVCGPLAALGLAAAVTGTVRVERAHRALAALGIGGLRRCQVGQQRPGRIGL